MGYTPTLPDLGSLSSERISNEVIIQIQPLTGHYYTLPRLSGNRLPPNPSNNFTGYTSDRLFVLLKNYTLTCIVGVAYASITTQIRNPLL